MERFPGSETNDPFCKKKKKKSRETKKSSALIRMGVKVSLKKKKKLRNSCNKYKKPLLHSGCVPPFFSLYQGMPNSLQRQTYHLKLTSTTSSLYNNCLTLSYILLQHKVRFHKTFTSICHCKAVSQTPLSTSIRTLFTAYIHCTHNSHQALMSCSQCCFS